jgi:hypothetical protein
MAEGKGAPGPEDFVKKQVNFGGMSRCGNFILEIPSSLSKYIRRFNQSLFE